jgi:hypothetical protein
MKLSPNKAEFTAIELDVAGSDCERGLAHLPRFGFSLYPRAAASQNNSTRIHLNEEKTL